MVFVNVLRLPRMSCEQPQEKHDARAHPIKKEEIMFPVVYIQRNRHVEI